MLVQVCRGGYEVAATYAQLMCRSVRPRCLWLRHEQNDEGLEMKQEGQSESGRKILRATQLESGCALRGFHALESGGGPHALQNLAEVHRSRKRASVLECARPSAAFRTTLLRSSFSSTFRAGSIK